MSVETDQQIKFRNKRTNREILVLKRRDNIVEVRYLKTDRTAWYSEEKFEELFVPI